MATRRTTLNPDRAAAFLCAVAAAQVHRVDKLMQETADAAAKDAARRIEEQYRIKPNAPEYRKWKEQHGYDRRALIRSGRYLNALQATRVSRLRYAVGAVGKDDDGTPLATIGRALEFGTLDGRIPARPHIRPAIRAAMRDAIKTLKGWKRVKAVRAIPLDRLPLTFKKD